VDMRKRQCLYRLHLREMKKPQESKAKRPKFLHQRMAYGANQWYVTLVTIFNSDLLLIF
jgi:hypothetical protein